MRLLAWSNRFASLATVILASSIARGQPGILDRAATALDASPDCAQLNAVWRELQRPEAVPASERARADSLRARLISRRREHKCLTGGVGGGVQVNAWDAYRNLLAVVKAGQAACLKVETCPQLVADQDELVRVTLVNIRELPPRDPRRLALEKDLAVVFTSVVPFESLIKRLGTAPSKDKEAFLDAAVDLFVREGYRKPGLERIGRIVSKVEANQVAPGDVEKVLDAAVALYLKSGGEQLEIEKRLLMAPLLTQPEGRQVLEEGLRQLARRHPYLKVDAHYAEAERGLSAGLPPEQLLRSFLQLLDRGLFNELEFAIREAQHQPVPQEIDELAIVLFFAKPASDPDSSRFVSTLTRSFFQRTAGSVPAAVRPFQEVPSQDVATLKEWAPIALRVNTTRNDAPTRREASQRLGDFCRQNRGGWARRLCTGPYSYAILVDFKEEGQTLSPGFQCWAGRDGDEVMETFSDHPLARDARDPDIESSGTVLAAESLHRCRLPAPPPPPPPPRAGEAWIAGLFAGAPYIVDSRSKNWPAVLFSTLDAGFLTAGVAGLGLSVYYRNEYSQGGTSSLDRANTSLVVGMACLGGAVLTRVVAGLLYRYSPKMWCSGRDCTRPR